MYVPSLILFDPLLTLWELYKDLPAHQPLEF